MSQNSDQFQQYPVSPLLAPFVKSIWSLQGNGGPRSPRERILPDGCVELVIHFRVPFRNYFADGTTTLQPTSFVVGQMRQFLEIGPAGQTGFVAVRFSARGAYRFFRAPMSEVADLIVPLREVWNGRANEYTDRVAVARGMAPRVRIVEQMLHEALRADRGPDIAVERCVELIQGAVELPTVQELASTIGLSSRQLGRRFHNGIGMNPKEFVRVNRFIRAAHRLRAQTDGNFTETAYACGYFDQAHFNHDFREFAGMTPKEFVTTENVAI
jgi:AraC-like DNA-binding protein